VYETRGGPNVPGKKFFLPRALPRECPEYTSISDTDMKLGRFGGREKPMRNQTLVFRLAPFDGFHGPILRRPRVGRNSNEELTSFHLEHKIEPRHICPGPLVHRIA